MKVRHMRSGRAMDLKHCLITSVMRSNAYVLMHTDVKGQNVLVCSMDAFLEQVHSLKQQLWLTKAQV